MYYKLSKTCTALGKVIKKPDISFSFLSYLLCGEKSILIDTVPERASEQFIEDLNELISIKDIHALILNHSEEDHSGGLGKLLAIKPDLPIFCTKACKDRLYESFPDAHFNIINKDSCMQIGQFYFKFILTPGMHWDDNMVTYFENEHILFSNDLFGQYVGEEPPVDEYCSQQQMLAAISNYYEKVFKLADSSDKQKALSVSGLPIRTIAPGHGVVLQKYVSDILEYYQIKSNN